MLQGEGEEEEEEERAVSQDILLGTVCATSNMHMNTTQDGLGTRLGGCHNCHECTVSPACVAVWREWPSHPGRTCSEVPCCHIRQRKRCSMQLSGATLHAVKTFSQSLGRTL